MGNLYDRDILAWSEQQAWLVREHAAGRCVNDAEIDWLNIAEEIEGVGREQLHAVESLSRQQPAGVTADPLTRVWSSGAGRSRRSQRQGSPSISGFREAALRGDGAPHGLALGQARACSLFNFGFRSRLEKSSETSPRCGKTKGAMGDYALDWFRLNTRNGTVPRGNEPVALGQHAAVLLRARVKRSGVLVSKDDLSEAVWPGLVVEGSNLSMQPLFSERDAEPAHRDAEVGPPLAVGW